MTKAQHGYGTCPRPDELFRLGQSATRSLYTVAAGRITHVEFYEVEDLDRALARFEALGADRDDRNDRPPV